jgi:uncharacterized membrane protein
MNPCTLPLSMRQNVSRVSRPGIWITGLLFILAGINHFIHPGTYLRIMPPNIPAHQLMVDLSGVAEIVVGILVIPEKTRKVGAWLMIALLLLIFPANIQMTIDWTRQQHPMLWLAWLRLPLQALMIWWAYRLIPQQRKHS